MTDNPYSETNDASIAVCRRIHGNSEQTHVAVLTVGQNYVAVAYDVDPKEYHGLDAEMIHYGPTQEECVSRAERWMQNNPKGVLGGGQGESSSKFKKFVVKAVKRLNEYGNKQMQNMDQSEKQ